MEHNQSSILYSLYYYEVADVERARQMYELYSAEADAAFCEQMRKKHGVERGSRPSTMTAEEKLKIVTTLLQSLFLVGLLPIHA